MGERYKEEIQRYRREKKKAEKKGCFKDIAILCNTLGQLLYETGDIANALKEHNEELSLCEKIDDKLGIGIAHRRISECLLELCQYEEALKHSNLYLDYATNEDHLVEIQRANATIGRIYFVLSEDIENGFIPRTVGLIRAKQAFINSLSICEQLTDQLTLKDYSDMKLRLLLNLGLVEEACERIQSAIEYVQVAISIAKNFKLDEEIYRCYFALQSLYQRCDKINLAVECINELIKNEVVARNKEKLVNCFNTLALLYVQQNQFEAAVKLLQKSLKAVSNNVKEQKATKKLLKRIQNLKHSIFRLENVDGGEMELKLSIYDSLADQSFKLNLFPMALGYYNLELNVANELNKSSDDIAEIYVSLAVTAFEDKKFDQAINYYKLELQHRDTDYQQICQTWLKIAEAQLQIDVSYETMLESYQKALQHAELAKKPSLEKQVMNALAYFYQLYAKIDSLAEIKKKLTQLENVLEEENDEQIRDDVSSESSDDSADEDVSFLSEEEENEIQNTANVKRNARGKNAAKSWKKNHFGETPLHVACIQGNLRSVKMLLSNGHPVQVRDNSGWTPLHEAANNGHYEIVELLLEKGALINDRGGPECQGITPLHDACDNGHIKIVLLLLEKGADARLKNNNGDNALDRLKSWLKTNDNSSDVNILNDVKQAIKKLYAKVYCKEYTGSFDEYLTAVNETNLEDSDDNQNYQNPIDSEIYQQEDIIMEVSEQPRKAPMAYKAAIKSVGSATSRAINIPNFNESSRKRKRSAPALIPDDNYIRDDWLICDIKESRHCNNNIEKLWSKSKTPKKKKNPVKKLSSAKKYVVYKDTKDFSSDDNNDIKILDDNDFIVNSSPIINISSNIVNNENKWSNKDRHQQLLDSNKQREKVKLQLSSNCRPENQAAIDTVDSVYNTTNKNFAVSGGLMKLKVRIENKLVLVPILSDTATVSWLTTEAADRYYKSFHLKPQLYLTTKDGAHLAAEDKVNILFKDNDEVSGTVLNWDLQPVAERYRNVSHRLNVTACERVLLHLEAASMTGILNFTDMALRPSYFASICETIMYEVTIKELHLCNNCLSNTGLEKLTLSLQSLPNVTLIDLSNNGITHSGLRYLADGLSSKLGCLSKLLNLTLSYNYLEDSSAPIIVEILQHLPLLQTLYLSCCCLTINFFANHRLSLSSAFAIGQLQNIDMSYNDFGNTGVEMLIRCCKQAPQLALLNLTGTITCNANSFVMMYVEQMLSNLPLRELYLSECSIGEEQVATLCKILPKLTCLVVLYLDSNIKLCESNLTQILLQASVSDCCLEVLSMLGCAVKNLDSNFYKALRCKVQALCPLRNLFIDLLNVIDSDMQKELNSVWLTRWPNGIVKITGKNIIELSDCER